MPGDLKRGFEKGFGKGFEMALSASVMFPETSEQKSFTRLVVAVSIGNALEWYDISSYGYFAVYVSRAFFPNSDQAISLLLTFGTFGLAFLIRPIGGVVLGAYADRHGRKASLMISIVLMTIGTLLIAIMPTFETIGILAPIAVLAARLIQGFRPAANSAVQRRFWWSTCPAAADSSQAGNLRARAWGRCCRPRSASASPHG